MLVIGALLLTCHLYLPWCQHAAMMANLDSRAGASGGSRSLLGAAEAAWGDVDQWLAANGVVVPQLLSEAAEKQAASPPRFKGATRPSLVSRHAVARAGDGDDLAMLLQEQNLGEHYEKLRVAAGGTSAAHLERIGRAGLTHVGIQKTPGHRLWKRILELASDVDEPMLLDSAPPPRPARGPSPPASNYPSANRVTAAEAAALERGVGAKAAARALEVVARGGPFAWERGPWAGAVPSTCGLVSTLTGRPPDAPPPMSATIKGCPMSSCLAYGASQKSGGAERILDDAAISDITSLFGNATRISGAKSPCFRVSGAIEVHNARIRSKPTIDEDTVLCSQKHGGV